MFHCREIILFTVFYGAITYGLRNRHEPVCSKFHYEEQLLEKMIRLEVKFEQLLEDVQKLDASVSEERRAWTEEKAVQKQKLENWLKIQNANIESHVEKTKTFFEDQERKLARFSSDLLKLKNETVTELKDVVKQTKVAFEAHKVPKLNPSFDETIVFSEIKLNVGEGYDASSGIFKVPVDGVYLFMVQFCLQCEKIFLFDIMIDDDILTSAKHYIEPGGGYACYSSQTAARATLGSKVKVKSTFNHASATLIDDRTFVNSFTGVLISKT